ncbi:hypothetical protein HCUR_00737 [Holospora curviuscula]|uniref:Uncharacterized protein n=1 Tax=Holospora curviuscula TaxID=1082868 RepID=A0A2S5R943_9PROT|nr:hypothetical protein HCUR_00737 [Holospora curviuscula]
MKERVGIGLDGIKKIFSTILFFVKKVYRGLSIFNRLFFLKIIAEISSFDNKSFSALSS